MCVSYVRSVINIMHWIQVILLCLKTSRMSDWTARTETKIKIKIKIETEKETKTKMKTRTKTKTLDQDDRLICDSSDESAIPVSC